MGLSNYIFGAVVVAQLAERLPPTSADLGLYPAILLNVNCLKDKNKGKEIAKLLVKLVGFWFILKSLCAVIKLFNVSILGQKLNKNLTRGIPVSKQLLRMLSRPMTSRHGN